MASVDLKSGTDWSRITSVRSTPAAVRTASTRPPAASPAGKPPSGWTAGGRCVRFQPNRATTPTPARIGPIVRPGMAPAPGRNGRSERRRPESDQREDHRVRERVVVVVGQSGNDRGQARCGDREERRRPEKSETKPAGRQPIRAIRA